MKPQLEQRQQTTLRQMPKLATQLLLLNDAQLRSELVQHCNDNPVLELVEQSLPQVASSGPTLMQHLYEQLDKEPLSARQRADAKICASLVDQHGYLPQPADLAQTTGLAPARLRQAIAVLRNLEPVGVGAHDLAQAMLLQLEVCSASTAAKRAARLIITKHFDKLVRRRYDLLPQKNLAAALATFDLLQPRFADAFAPAAAAIVPELKVWRDAGVWRVRLCQQDLPVRLDKTFAKATTVSPRLRQKIHAARALLATLQFRHTTLLTVAQAAVDRQRNYFEHGPRGLKPLRLADIAGATGLSLSTVSATITHKYLAAPQGVIALKYLFQRATGDPQFSSAATLREAIKQLVAAEDPAAPLSDQKIMQLLSHHGSHPARRTVTKHRQAAGIPAAKLRHKAVLS